MTNRDGSYDCEAILTALGRDSAIGETASEADNDDAQINELILYCEKAGIEWEEDVLLK